MRQTICGEHKKFFHEKGWLALEEAISPSEVKEILKGIEKKRRALGPANQVFEIRFPSRSISEINHLLRRKNLTEIIFELFAKKPLRVGWDLAFHIFLPESRQECYAALEGYGSLCALLIPLEGEPIGAVYLCTLQGFHMLPVRPSMWHLILIFTTAPLNDQNHPVLYR